MEKGAAWGFCGEEKMTAISDERIKTIFPNAAGLLPGPVADFRVGFGVSPHGSGNVTFIAGASYVQVFRN
jgi:hypothetical protein